jgi:glycosyltransferase involved in cell wall biosynthesis
VPGVAALPEAAPRILFVPVSGTFGMGEYARSLAIARGIQQRWPGASIQFILSREAPYAAQTPFATTLLASSPTFHSAAVIGVMRQWRPDVVIFDNAGRTAQLRAARQLGARVVYISARRRQRGKAFRLRWMRLIDEHWIAYPEFIAGSLRRLERLKLYFLRRPAVRYLDVILAPPTRMDGESTLARIGCEPGSFVLVVPGGGTGHPGANDAVGTFLGAAQALAASGIPTVFVGRADAAAARAQANDRVHFNDHAPAGDRAHPPSPAPLRTPGSLPQTDLAELMRAARLIVVNGGSTLLQSIACGKACIAVPIAGDQRERIRRCVAAEVALAAALDSSAIVRVASGLLQNESERNALAARAAALGLADGVAVAVRALHALLAAR